MSTKERSVSLQSNHRHTYAIYRRIFAYPFWRHFRPIFPSRYRADVSKTVKYSRLRQVDRRSKVGNQTAEPQRVAATTTVHSPATSGAEDSSTGSVRKYLGSRSPSGQSPVTKSRKTPHNANLAISGSAAAGQSSTSGQSGSSRDTEKEIGSPKSRTWKGLVARQFRKIQGTPSSQASNYVVLPEGASIGVPLALCPMVSHSLKGF